MVCKITNALQKKYEEVLPKNKDQKHIKIRTET